MSACSLIFHKYFRTVALSPSWNHLSFPTFSDLDQSYVQEVSRKIILTFSTLLKIKFSYLLFFHFYLFYHPSYFGNRQTQTHLLC